MTEPLVKVKRLAYVRVAAPDRAKAEEFLLDFGLRIAARTTDATYLRGTDAESHCYVLTEGPSDVLAIAFEVDDAADLETIARVEGASAIEKLDEPAGGSVVRLTDPNGLRVEIVHGQATLEATEAAPAHEYNMNGDQRRRGPLPGIRPGASHVRRIGHLVLESPDPARLHDWYEAHFGLRKSDEVHLPDGRTQMRFAHVDRGDEFVDHHVVGFQYALDEGVRVQHIAFEVGNFDDLMAGHQHLKARRRKPIWGVGRHRYGGQIYDYWANPWGVIHEHWTDTDLVNTSSVATDSQFEDLEEYWGPMPSPAFIVARWNWKAVRNLAALLSARFRASRAR